MSLAQRRLPLFPISTEVRAVAEDHAFLNDGESSHLFVGDCDLVALAERYDTPLYLYDQVTLDAAVTAYRSALDRSYPGRGEITYAGKAGLNLALARWAADTGLWVDCTGVGELYVAVRAGVPREQILVHGVNKSHEDLVAAVMEAGVIVVDNLSELNRLVALRQERDGEFPALWVRVRPGTAVDTHAYRQTGQEDSKFGMSQDDVIQAVQICRDYALHLEGIHFHQGSQFFDPEPVGDGIQRVLEMIEQVRSRLGWAPTHLSPGGGWAAAYHEEELPQPAVDAYVVHVAQQVAEGCRRLGLSLPMLHLEPGRSIVAQAGVALYRVGAIKETATRRWVLVDGGMADNIRPALYGAHYSALPVVNPDRPADEPVWIAGPYCESGDVLMENLPMPALAEGELLAVPASGAYHLGMASNYNGARMPAVVWIREGHAYLIRRRETVEDLISRDLPLPNPAASMPQANGAA